MRALALTLETISAHSSTDGKVQAAAAFLAGQRFETVAVAARFLAGAPLPPGCPATQVGRSTLIDLVAAFAGAERPDLIRRATALGDLGLAVAEILEETPRRGRPLALTEVAEAVRRLGEVGATTRHRLLSDLMGRASPLEAKYLTKLLLGSLRTGMQSARVEDAIALAFDRPASLVRRACMLLGDVGAAAERAAAGTLNEVTLRAFRPVRLMLAAAADTPAAVVEMLPPPVIAEHKYDGIRAQLHLVDGDARLYSRALEDVTHYFPEVRSGGVELSGEWILDGEVVAWLDERALSFATLQRRLGRKQVPLTLLLDAPVAFMAFDVLRAEGRDLIEEPLVERRRRLDALPEDGPVRRTPWRLLENEDQIADWFRATLEAGDEGAIFKSPRGRYRPGKRGRSWVKLKQPLGSLDVVVTGAEYGRGKRAGLLSDLIFAIRGPDGLLDTGRAYSGLTDAEIAGMTEELMRATRSRNGSTRTVEPRVVLEVAFDGVTPSDRHPSGYALRFPRILRRRTDLEPDEISTLDDLRRLHDRSRT